MLWCFSRFGKEDHRGNVPSPSIEGTKTDSCCCLSCSSHREAWTVSPTLKIVSFPPLQNPFLRRKSVCTPHWQRSILSLSFFESQRGTWITWEFSTWEMCVVSNLLIQPLFCIGSYSDIYVLIRITTQHHLVVLLSVVCLLPPVLLRLIPRRCGILWFGLFLDPTRSLATFWLLTRILHTNFSGCFCWKLRSGY